VEKIDQENNVIFSCKDKHFALWPSNNPTDIFIIIPFQNAFTHLILVGGNWKPVLPDQFFFCKR